MLTRTFRLVALAVVATAAMLSPHRSTVHREAPHRPGVHRSPAHRPTKGARHWPWGITPVMMRAAERVHDCEQPNSWSNLGIFPGGIGMTDANWQQFRVRGMSAHAAWLDHARVRSASPRAQARVLYRFADHYFGGQLPDQHGTCAAY